MWSYAFWNGLFHVNLLHICVQVHSHYSGIFAGGWKCQCLLTKLESVVKPLWFHHRICNNAWYTILDRRYPIVQLFVLWSLNYLFECSFVLFNANMNQANCLFFCAALFCHNFLFIKVLLVLCFKTNLFSYVINYMKEIHKMTNSLNYFHFQ